MRSGPNPRSTWRTGRVTCTISSPAMKPVAPVTSTRLGSAMAAPADSRRAPYARCSGKVSTVRLSGRGCTASRPACCACLSRSLPILACRGREGAGLACRASLDLQDRIVRTQPNQRPAGRRPICGVGVPGAHAALRSRFERLPQLARPCRSAACVRRGLDPRPAAGGTRPAGLRPHCLPESARPRTGPAAPTDGTLDPLHAHSKP